MTILTFDDLPTTSPGPGQYGDPGFAELGYAFGPNIRAIEIGSSTNWANANPMSGTEAAYSAEGPAIITAADGTTFSFINTYITGWNTYYVDGAIQGYLGGSLVGSVNFEVMGPDAGGGHPVAPWALITANFATVDQVVITGYGNSFLIENTQIGTAVPEPGTWALLLFGFAFFALKGIWPNEHSRSKGRGEHS